MAFGLYKPGQGKYSRGTAAAILAGFGIWGGLQTYNWMDNLIDRTSWYAGYWVPGLILVSFLSVGYYLTNTAKPANFLIETEIEMKKVTWPTYQEVLAATGVVIVVVILIGIFLFGVDRLLWEPFFKLIGILPKTPAG